MDSSAAVVDHRASANDPIENVSSSLISDHRSIDHRPTHQRWRLNNVSSLISGHRSIDHRPIHPWWGLNNHSSPNTQHLSSVKHRSSITDQVQLASVIDHRPSATLNLKRNAHLSESDWSGFPLEATIWYPHMHSMLKVTDLGRLLSAMLGRLLSERPSSTTDP